MYDDTYIKESSKELHIIDHQISDLEAQENRNRIIQNFKSFSDNPETINMGNVWKRLKKLWPKHNTNPKAKRNHIGTIISTPREIKELMKKEYKQTL